jgi:alkanesulfonate monooxygenase SsuD/methylene tetrahydromethanopterin reductase-like flavin-dependent oxidoreductase (luciferase family)
MDEEIAVIRGLLGGGYFEFHGRVFDVDPVKMAPVPTAPVPFLVGGHGEAALRRAAHSGDGWMHGGGAAGELPRLLERLRVLRAESGRADDAFEVHAISLEAFSVDGVRRLEEQGVTDVIVGFRWPYTVGPDVEPLQSKLDNLRRFADTVIAGTRG